VKRPTCVAEVYALRDENTEIRGRDSFRRFGCHRPRWHRGSHHAVTDGIGVSWAREPAAPLFWVLERVVAGLEHAARWSTRWSTIPHAEPMNRWPK
jgi:hypothetical protein